VDGRAHQRPLHDRPPLERPREGVALEPLDPTPQADVHRGRVLRLQAAHALERGGQAQRRPFEQQLAREQGAVELALGQDGRSAGGHRPKLSLAGVSQPPGRAASTLTATTMAARQDLLVHSVQDARRRETRAPRIRQYGAILQGGEAIHPRSS
jgi:hypothetical protein